VQSSKTAVSGKLVSSCFLVGGRGGGLGCGKGLMPVLVMGVDLAGFWGGKGGGGVRGNVSGRFWVLGGFCSGRSGMRSFLVWELLGS